MRPSHADVLETEFSRYVADYDVRTTSGSAETLDLLASLPAGSRVALLVSETELPDEHVLRAFHAWRSVVPTARGSSPPTWSSSAPGLTSCGPGWRPASTTPTC